MKPPAFDYESPETLERAVELLSSDDDVKALAGGQSLVPLLSLRLTYPDLLVDLRRIPGLDSIEISDDAVVIGATVKQRDAELDTRLAERCPLLIRALRHVAHPQIRSRGTIGGSIAHADPAAELPAAMLALEGRVRVAGSRGEREISGDDLFAGPLTTTLEADELIKAVELPAARPGSGSACVEVARRKGDYAIAGSAAYVEVGDGAAVSRARLAFFGVGDRPLRSEAVEEAVLGMGADEAPDAAMKAAAETIEPGSDPELSADYRRHLTGVVARRALEQALKEVR